MSDPTPLVVKTRAVLQGVIQSAADMKVDLDQGVDIRPDLSSLLALVQATFDDLSAEDGEYANMNLQPDPDTIPEPITPEPTIIEPVAEPIPESAPVVASAVVEPIPDPSPSIDPVIVEAAPNV